MAALSAPYLKQYFEVVSKGVEELASMDMGEMMAMAFDPEKKKAFEKKTEDQNTQLKELVTKSFKHHDTKDTNVLDKEEATVFFTHLVDEQTCFIPAVAQIAIKKSIEMGIQMMAGFMGEDSADVKEGRENIEKMVQEGVKEAKENAQKAKEDYYKNKVDRDAAAFKVIDVNNDGTIQLEELIAAMTPNDPKMNALMAALGITEMPTTGAGPGGGGQTQTQSFKMEGNMQAMNDGTAECKQQ